MHDSDERRDSKKGFDQSLASASDQRWIVQGVELIVVVECMSVDPGDGDPLRGGGHQVYRLLQQPDGVVDLVVDDGLVKVVGVGPLQHLGFLLEPLKRVVLRV